MKKYCALLPSIKTKVKNLGGMWGGIGFSLV